LKFIIAVLILSLCLPATSASDGSSRSAEATTAITLPVDYVTVYPDGLMAVKRTGSLELTEGVHSFVINLPEKADKRSVLLSVSNATWERVVYEANPIFTLNVTSPGMQRFDLTYLMRSAATWKPVYDLQLTDETASVRAHAVVTNLAGEDLENVRLKLVAGLPSAAPSAAAQERLGKSMRPIRRTALLPHQASLRPSTYSSWRTGLICRQERRSDFPSSSRMRPWSGSTPGMLPARLRAPSWRRSGPTTP